MPLSDPETADADEAWPEVSPDDLIVRLVEEMAGASGGAVRDSTEIDLMLERLSELRADSADPQEQEPEQDPEPEPAATVPKLILAVPEAEPVAPAPRPEPSLVPPMREKVVATPAPEPVAASAARVAAPAPKGGRPPFGSPGSVDDVILEAVRSAGTQSGAQPIPLPARRMPPRRARPPRSHSSFYLVALFLVTFASGVLLLNRNWFVDQGSSGEYWGKDVAAATPPAEVGGILAAQAAGEVAEIQVEPEIEAGADVASAGWVRRKVKTYRVDADGAIAYEVGADPAH